VIDCGRNDDANDIDVMMYMKWPTIAIITTTTTITQRW